MHELQHQRWIPVHDLPLIPRPPSLKHHQQDLPVSNRLTVPVRGPQSDEAASSQLVRLGEPLPCGQGVWGRKGSWGA